MHDIFILLCGQKRISSCGRDLVHTGTREKMWNKMVDTTVWEVKSQKIILRIAKEKMRRVCVRERGKDERPKKGLRREDKLKKEKMRRVREREGEMRSWETEKRGERESKQIKEREKERRERETWRKNARSGVKEAKSFFLFSFPLTKKRANGL